MLYSQVAVQKFALMISACGAVFWGSVTVWQLRQAFNERNFSFEEANLSYISSVIVICLPTEHLGVHENSLKRLPAFQIELEFGSVGFWGEGKTRVPGEKTSRSKGDNQQQTQPTYGVDARIRTRATLVGGQCSHHCAKPCSQKWAVRVELVNLSFCWTQSWTRPGLELKDSHSGKDLQKQLLTARSHQSRRELSACKGVQVPKVINVNFLLTSSIQ